MAALDSGPSPSQQATARLLDDPQEWSSFGRPAGPATPADPSKEPTDFPAWDSHVVLEGMHCAACALDHRGCAACRARSGEGRSQCCHAPRPCHLAPRAGASLRVDGGRAARRLPGASRTRCLCARAPPGREPPCAVALAGGRLLHDAGDDVCVAPPTWPAPATCRRRWKTLLRWASWVISLPVVLFCCGPFFSSALRATYASAA